MSTLRDCVREARHRAQLTMDEAAALAGLSGRSGWHRHEHHEPSHRTAARLVAAVLPDATLACDGAGWRLLLPQNEGG